MIDTESEPGAWEREIAMRPKTQEAGGRVMSKYKLVPVEPTTEMEDAFWGVWQMRGRGKLSVDAMKAMLAAAPSPEWIKVSERLPTRDEADLYCDVWVMRTSWGVTRAKWQIVKEDEDITHWMPKPRVQPPSPPEGE